MGGKRKEIGKGKGLREEGEMCRRKAAAMEGKGRHVGVAGQGIPVHREEERERQCHDLVEVDAPITFHAPTRQLVSTDSPTLSLNFAIQWSAFDQNCSNEPK